MAERTAKPSSSSDETRNSPFNIATEYEQFIIDRLANQASELIRKRSLFWRFSPVFTVVAVLGVIGWSIWDSTNNQIDEVARTTKAAMNDAVKQIRDNVDTEIESHVNERIIAKAQVIDEMETGLLRTVSEVMAGAQRAQDDLEAATEASGQLRTNQAAIEADLFRVSAAIDSLTNLQKSGSVTRLEKEAKLLERILADNEPLVTLGVQQQALCEGLATLSGQLVGGRYVEDFSTTRWRTLGSLSVIDSDQQYAGVSPTGGVWLKGGGSRAFFYQELQAPERCESLTVLVEAAASPSYSCGVTVYVEDPNSEWDRTRIPMKLLEDPVAKRDAGELRFDGDGAGLNEFDILNTEGGSQRKSYSFQIPWQRNFRLCARLSYGPNPKTLPIVCRLTRFEVTASPQVAVLVKPE